MSDENKMTDKEAIEMMNRCLHEIESLKAQINNMAPKAEAYCVVRDIVALLPKSSQGYGEDVSWLLRKKIKELEATPAKDPA